VPWTTSSSRSVAAATSWNGISVESRRTRSPTSGADTGSSSAGLANPPHRVVEDEQRVAARRRDADREVGRAVGRIETRLPRAPVTTPGTANLTAAPRPPRPSPGQR
jgi:hypothetical protein